ncbi:MAG: adenylate/guanylate cyclase domain-containing protein [Alphaproteobacteria bacterium]
MPTPPAERKLVAILSADVVGYSRLMGADEAGTLATLSAHREVIDDLIGLRAGRIVGTAGDSILAEFHSVVEAVHCGVEIQQAMAARNADLPAARKMLFRIGINVGDVIAKGDDIFGDGVNVAARLQGLAAPGGICISRSVRDQLRDKSPFLFEDQGEQVVKNIVRPVRVFTLRFEGAPAGITVSAEPPAEEIRAGSDETERAFWDSVADSKTAADYAAYLERYPTGAFAALARVRLAGLAAAEAAAGSDEVKLEITYWESVKDSDDPAMVRSYLDTYPQGHFRLLAEARLGQLEPGAA